MLICLCIPIFFIAMAIISITKFQNPFLLLVFLYLGYTSGRDFINTYKRVNSHEHKCINTIRNP